MQKISLTQLNSNMTASHAAIRMADHRFLQELKKIASYVQSNASEKPVILLSGPSGSGKTTTAFLLERFLDSWGIETHTVSMDNFFSTMTSEQHKLAAAGKLDLESPDRLDVPYLNQQLRKIVAGEPVWMPKYHFSTSIRDDKSWCLTRKPQELLILEGIHALNPDVITIPDTSTVRLYVSVRTRVTHRGFTMHPSRLRLLRRMIRDRNFRKRSPQETIAMFRHVQIGEQKYISPFKNRATFSIDTFLPYELGIYKSFAADIVYNDENELLLKDLRALWDDVTPLPMEDVPADSLVREFIGGSVFSY